MVQSLTGPLQVPTSQQAGGMSPDGHANAMSAPGSDPVTGPPTAETVSPQRLPQPAGSTAGDDREVLSPGGSVTSTQLPARGPGGRWVTGTTVKDPGGKWKLTPRS